MKNVRNIKSRGKGLISLAFGENKIISKRLIISNPIIINIKPIKIKNSPEFLQFK